MGPGLLELTASAGVLTCGTPRAADVATTDPVVAALDVDTADLAGFGEPGDTIGHPLLVFRPGRTTRNRVVAAGKAEWKGEILDLKSDATLHPCREFGVLSQPRCQIERVIALPIDTTIGVDSDPGENPHAPLVGVPAQRLRRFHSTVAIAEHAIDDDRWNA